MSQLRYFLFTMISTPFIIMAAMFVPVLGQLLALLNFGLTIALLKMRRSFSMALIFLLAVVGFFVLLSFISPFLAKNSDIPLFFLLALAIPYNFFYGFMIAREIYTLANVSNPRQNEQR